jgi:hypothetical protein
MGSNGLGSSKLKHSMTQLDLSALDSSISDSSTRIRASRDNYEECDNYAATLQQGHTLIMNFRSLVEEVKDTDYFTSHHDQLRLLGFLSKRLAIVEEALDQYSDCTKSLLHALESRHNMPHSYSVESMQSEDSLTSTAGYYGDPVLSDHSIDESVLDRALLSVSYGLEKQRMRMEGILADMVETDRSHPKRRERRVHHDLQSFSDKNDESPRALKAEIRTLLEEWNMVDIWIARLLQCHSIQ